MPTDLAFGRVALTKVDASLTHVPRGHASLFSPVWRGDRQNDCRETLNFRRCHGALSILPCQNKG